MPVMEIRPVWMIMDEGVMRVRMGMVAGTGEGRSIIRMLMVMVEIIMVMTVVMHERVMPVEVPMVLGHQQPGTGSHDRERSHKPAVRGFPKDEKGEEDPEERGEGKEETGPGSAE